MSVGGDRGVARDGERPQRITRAPPDAHVEVHGAADAARGHGVEADVGVEVTFAAQILDDAHALALEGGVAVGAGRRQGAAGADGDPALDLVLADAPVALDEDVTQAIVGHQVDGRAMIRRARRRVDDGGAVANGVQRLPHARHRADGRADRRRRPGPTRRTASRAARPIARRLELVLWIEVRAPKLVADDDRAGGRGGRLGGQRRRRCSAFDVGVARLLGPGRAARARRAAARTGAELRAAASHGGETSKRLSGSRSAKLAVRG